jgi:MYXO-CTERM domain-containing protein
MRGCQVLTVVAAISSGSTVWAAIPAGYTGTPYMGKAQEIPGRVELASLDEGGLNVAFFADHRRENAVAEGYAPISGDDFRPGNLMLPNICKTNRAVEKPGEGSSDFWEDGKPYPSEQNLYEYYMGYAHTVDWVRVTVNVKVAGTYNVSSNWACANPECGLSIWFNDGTTKTDNQQKPLDGENKSGVIKLPGTNDYHKWRAYPNFAKVTLAAGEQLMTFHVEVANHLQYGHLQFDLEGGNPQGGAGGTGGAATGGAATGGGATGGTGGTGSNPIGGSTSTAGTATTQGGTGTVGTAGSTPNGGPAGTGGAPSGLGGSGAVTPGATSNDSGGCALASGNVGNAERAAALLGALALLVQRRRRRG